MKANGRPETVAELANWFSENIPGSDWNFEYVTDQHLRSLQSHLPLVCNTCGYDTRQLGKGGQKFANIWYNKASCAGCSGNGRSTPSALRARAQARSTPKPTSRTIFRISR